MALILRLGALTLYSVLIWRLIPARTQGQRLLRAGALVAGFIIIRILRG